MSQERLVLLYVLIRGLPIDVGTILEMEIRECTMKQHKNTALLFLSLIKGICIVSGVRVTGKDELIRNTWALNARAIERIASETAAAPTEPVGVTSACRAVGMNKKLQELSANINQCVVAQ